MSALKKKIEKKKWKTLKSEKTELSNVQVNLIKNKLKSNLVDELKAKNQWIVIFIIELVWFPKIIASSQALLFLFVKFNEKKLINIFNNVPRTKKRK